MRERWEPVANTQLHHLAMSKCGLCGAIVLAGDKDRHWSYHHLVMEAIIVLLQDHPDPNATSQGI